MKAVLQTCFYILPFLLGSLACSLTDNTVKPAETPISPISFASQSNALPIEEIQGDLVPTSSNPVSCTVSATVLHLRSCAGTDCPVDAWLLQGESLTILQPGTAWINVQTSSGKTGWVNATYCGGK